MRPTFYSLKIQSIILIFFKENIFQTNNSKNFGDGFDLSLSLTRMQNNLRLKSRKYLPQQGGCGLLDLAQGMRKEKSGSWGFYQLNPFDTSLLLFFEGIFWS